MSPSRDRVRLAWARAGWWGFAAATAVMVAFALLSRAPGPEVGLVVAAVAAATALAIRIVPERLDSALVLLPLVPAWGYLGLAAPITLLTEILAALAALSALVWVADASSPTRASGLRRAGDVLALPAVGAAIALVAGLLIPPGELRIGVAALLLVAALALVAVVLARLQPAREAPASSL